MARVEIYINMEKATIRGGTPYRAGKNPYAVRRRFGSQEDNISVVETSFSGLSPAERTMFDTAQGFADGHGFECRVYDVSKLGPWLRARLHGIKEFPAVRMGKSKFIGAVSAKELDAIINA